MYDNYTMVNENGKNYIIAKNGDKIRYDETRKFFLKLEIRHMHLLQWGQY